MPTDIEGFVDWVIDQKPNMADLDPEVRQEIKSEFVELLSDKINATILTKIPDDKLDEFDAILARNDGEAAQKFCEDNVPGLSDIVAQVLVDFKLQYVGD